MGQAGNAPAHLATVSVFGAGRASSVRALFLPSLQAIN